ncbi:MAG: DEAD/DEAH box helicase [Micrococcales bacterium]|nr:DEAD/DEAH box helicase [Micrococcales bacterium]
MAQILIDRDWIAALDGGYLRRAFGDSTYERALGYARSGHVEDIETGDNGRMLTAGVRGSRSRPYQCLVVAADRRRGESRASANPATPATRCSCPVQVRCKHAVALIIVARGLTLGAGGQPAPGLPEISAAAPGWERTLRVVASHRPSPAAEATTPLALQVTVAPARPPRPGGASGRGSANPAQLRIQPVVRGASGRWVKSTVTWQQLQYPPAHVRLDPLQRTSAVRLRDLRNRGASWSYSAAPAQLSLADLGPDVWALLAQATDAGVELVPERGGDPPIHLAVEPARLLIELRRAPDGGLLVDAGTSVAGRSLPVADVNLVGSPPHGLWIEEGGELVLAGFRQPLDGAQTALVTSTEPILVPAAHVPHFHATYYPVLRQILDLQVADDVEVPKIEPPRLALDATFEADHQVLLQWTYLYGGPAGTRLPLIASRDDPQAPVRDPAAEQALVDDLPATTLSRSLTHLIGNRRQLVPVQRFHGLDTISVATQLLPALQARDDVVITVHAQPPQYREAGEAPRIELSISDSGDSPSGGGATDWFDLGVDVTIEGETVPFLPLFTALARGIDHLVLESGTWFRLDRPELEELRRLIEEARLLDDEAGDGPLRISPVQAGLWEELVELGVVREQSQAWSRSAGALLAMDPSQAAPVPAGVRATLRPYQVQGFQWLALLWDARLGGILADDMGLGKTLQVLALTERARADGELDESPVLVVAPTSVVSTWAGEAAKFTPDLRVASVTQTAAKRGATLAQVATGAHVLVTSYTLLRLEADDYARRRWAGLVLDEAQFVKNRHSKVYQSVRRVPAPVRFAITGTPLENNLMDLWSLLSVAAPGLFADPAVFTDLYRRPIEGGDSERLARLQRRIRPLMLRRTKEAVARDLLPKQEQIVSVRLSPAHRRIYDTRLHRERQRVLQLIDDLDRNRMTILRSLTVLRQLSLAPALVDSAHATTRSSKIDVLMEMVQDVIAGGHRALVFSQFTGFLRLVRDRLDAAGVGYAYLDGRTRDRERRIAQFRQGDDPLFLISLKAGGFGLTLTEADYVFVLDPWWNPAAEAQAVDRVHRIGQDKHVNVYRLVAADTIEEKVVALQERKRDLFARVVGEGGELSAPLSADDIRGLLEG